MKKIAVLALFLALISFNAMSQGDLRFGVQASPSFSWLDSDDKFVNSNGTNLGLRLGVFGEYYFREDYAFTTGIGFAFGQGGTLLYDERGQFWTKTEDLPTAIDTIPAGANLKHRVQYVEIPVGLKLRTREFGHIRGFVEPHLTFGFQSKALGDLTAEGFGDETKDLNIKKEINGLALGWGFGVGGEYSVSTATAIIAGIYYQRIFTDVTDDNGTIENKDTGVWEKNDIKAIGNSLTIKLGVRF
jgi:hypothetical protein